MFSIADANKGKGGGIKNLSIKKVKGFFLG